MKVLLMRHGQAVGSGGGPDAHRYLTAAGRAASFAVATALCERGLSATHVYTSPLVRAVQTAELVARAAEHPGPIVVHAPLVPGGTTAQALSVLDVHADGDVVAMVTHEPTVRVLAGHLSGLGAGFPGFRTSGVAVLDVVDGSSRLLGRFDPDRMAWRSAEDLDG